MKRLVLISLLWTVGAHAQPLQTVFERANDAAFGGRSDEAIAEYERLLEAGAQVDVTDTEPPIAVEDGSVATGGDVGVFRVLDAGVETLEGVGETEVVVDGVHGSGTTQQEGRGS